jgi:hypothetical protein
MAENVTRNQYLARWSALDSDFTTWRSRYEDISRNILPVSGRFFAGERNRGDKTFNKIYDSTGTQALKTLSAGLMAGMTSPARPWFRLSTSDPALTKFAPVKVWLDDVTRILQAIFSRSNTYRALHSMYGELGAYGTAVSIVAEDFDTVIHHYTLTAGEYRLATNYKGEVDCMYRECEKTVAELVKEFGRENCSTSVVSAYDSGKLDAKVTIIHVIEPRADRDPTKRDAKNMPWRSVYFEKASDNTDKVLRESGFKMFRVLAPRWETWGGDTYGISPSMEALGDIRQLQHQQLRKAQGIDKMVDPPLILPTSAKNGMHNFLPGGTSYIDMNGPGQVQTAYNVNLNLSYLLEDIRDVRDRINGVFYADLFKMLAMNDAQRGQMTATEVAERHEEKLLMLGPVLERQHNELLDPKIELTFMRALEAGILPAPPEELHGHELNVEFVSILAQAQRAIGTNGIDRFVMSLGQVAAVKPDVLDKFDADEWADTYSDMLGVDPSLIVASDKVAIVRKQRAQAQQAAQQTAMAESASKSAANLAGADTGGKNALTDVMHNLTGYT